VGNLKLVSSHALVASDFASAPGAARKAWLENYSLAMPGVEYAEKISGDSDNNA